MAPRTRPTLVLIAGPNGAGKTTLYETRVAPMLKAPFINADLIQRDELKDLRAAAAYEAAAIASERRAEFLRLRQSFVTETVFSHPSKLELIEQARASGFRVIVLHVGIAAAALAVARVAERAEAGGHDVPEDKIRDRYDRNGPLIRQAVLGADVGQVFDNSSLNRPPTHLITFTRGRPSFVLPNLPVWATDLYAPDLVI